MTGEKNGNIICATGDERLNLSYRLFHDAIRESGIKESTGYIGRSCPELAEGVMASHDDIVGFNAALGATVTDGGLEKRRRDVARFTCTIFGTPWYIHVRDDSSYLTFDDVVADATARLCVGQLSSRLSDDYFKNAASIAKQFTTDDLVVCSEGVRDGIYDAYLHFDPVPVSYADPDDLRVIPMQIVSGIPIWVAGEESCEGLDVCKGDFNSDGMVTL